jgi:RNA recognition motif-containing protein
LTPGQALEATKLDGKILDGKHHLQAKVSDPAKKQDRQGALYEGREVYISNVHWGALEEDVKAVFSSCGPVEKVRIPRNMNGKSKGIAFVSFTNKVYPLYCQLRSFSNICPGIC